MNNQEVIQILGILNSGWPNKPLDRATQGIWGLELVPFPFLDVKRVVTGFIRTEEWRPSLAQILRGLAVPRDAETASQAFASVLDAIKHVGAGGVPDISQRAMLAVRHLGGWGTVCKWSVDGRQWHRKEFTTEFEHLTTAGNARAVLNIRSLPEGKRVPALEGKRVAAKAPSPPPDPPEAPPAYLASQTIDKLTGDLLVRIRMRTQ